MKLTMIHEELSIDQQVSAILVEMVDIENKDIDGLVKMLDGAKRGLGLSNKLTGPTKKKHMSAILTNLNKIRGALARAIKELDSTAE